MDVTKFPDVKTLVRIFDKPNLSRISKLTDEDVKKVLPLMDLDKDLIVFS